MVENPVKSEIRPDLCLLKQLCYIAAYQFTVPEVSTLLALYENTCAYMAKQRDYIKFQTKNLSQPDSDCLLDATLTTLCEQVSILRQCETEGDLLANSLDEVRTQIMNCI